MKSCGKRHRLVIALLLLGAVAGCSAHTPGGPGITDVRRVVALGGGEVSQPQWSPDGRVIAYRRLVGERAPAPKDVQDLSLFDRLIYQLYANEELLFRQSLWVVPSGGGRARELKSSLPGEVVWRPDAGDLIYAKVVPVSLRHAPGDAEAATPPPTGWHLRVRAISSADGEETQLASLVLPRSGQFRPLDGGPLAMSPSGDRIWLFGEDPETFALGLGVIDLEHRQLCQVVGLPDSECYEFARSGGGQLYFTRGSESADPETNKGRCWTVLEVRSWTRYTVCSIDESGHSVRQETAGPSDCHPTPAPDDKRLAFIRLGSVWLREPDGAVRLLVERADEGRAGFCDGPVAWSPDGSRIAFVWNVHYRTSLWTAQVLR